MRGAQKAVQSGEIAKSDFTITQAKNIVRGIIKNDSGETLTPGTKLWLWGESFTVDENGNFETPPMPTFDGLDAVQEIVINRGLGNEFRIPLSFVSDDQPLEVELVAPSNSSQVNTIPKITLVATVNDELCKKIIQGEQLTLTAIVFPEDSTNLTWNSTGGTFNQSMQSNGNKRIKEWTAPANSGIATISVELKNSDGKSAKAFLPIMVEGVPSFIVTFETDGGSIVASQTILRGGKATKPTDPTKTGYTFAGWFKDSDKATAFDFTTETIRANTTIYAKWAVEAIATYTVTFDNNGGATAANPDKLIVNSGETVSSMPVSPTKVGHTFVAWNTRADGNGSEFNASSVVTADITVYAIYTVNKFSLNYTANSNGSITGSATQTIDFGMDGAAVTAVPDAGYSFAGWSDGNNDNPRTDTNVTANIEISASFVAINAGVSASNKFVHSENAGWINFSSDYGKVSAKLGANGYLSGYTWGENIGWIKLSAASATAPFANSAANNWGVNIANSGELSGYAYSETCGWINFGAAGGNAAVNLQTGEMSGYAWSENIGWIKLSGSTYKVQFSF